MRKISILITVLLISALSGCSSGLFSVHRIDVQQGNALAQESVRKLEVGMDQEQVRYLLGNPLVTGMFRPERWDYVYYFKPGNGDTDEHRVTVFFNNGQVVRIENDGTTTGQLASSVDNPNS